MLCQRIKQTFIVNIRCITYYLKNKMKLLSFATQKYEWGKIGTTSVVGQLAASADPKTVIDENQPYAELWMGTHPNGPSRIADNNQSLDEFIRENQSCLGESLTNRFGSQLPFLFKVLSVAKALSIQAHPNKVCLTDF